MRVRVVFGVVAVTLLYGIEMSAQPPAATAANQGVNPVRLMDRPEVRVSRVEIAPGAVRSVHTHDDVRFHLWIPISGKLEITIGSAKPVEAESGRAFFMEKGTPHGFRNIGNTPAQVLEIFVKDGAPIAGNDAVGSALAALFQPSK
ncbi:MAG TPA: cupin domain-containing protein [Bryobacteraceae bacterium]|jgi:quercetin dioxygenase-like cupin family protein